MLRQFWYNSLNVASRLLNLVLFWVVINKFGATKETDWFFFLYGFVYFLISTLFYSIECALVPSWPNISPRERAKFLNTCLLLGGRVATGVLLVGFGVTLYLPQVFGFANPFPVYQALLLSILLFIQPFFAYVSSLFSSVLQAQGHYFWPITHLSFRAVAALTVLQLSDHAGIQTLAVAYACGEFIRMVFLVWAGRNLVSGFRLTRLLDVAPYRRYFTAIGWMALMVLASASNTYVDFVMVGHLGEGSATLVEYASRLRWMPMLALSSVLTVLLGDWSRMEGESLPWTKIYRGAGQVALLGLLLCGTVVVTRQYWLPLVFMSERFSPGHLQTLSVLMFWYLSGASLMIATNVLSRGFLVWNRFRLMSVFGLVSVIVNIALNVAFIGAFGVVGVAMSTAGLDAVMLAVFVYWGVRIGREKDRRAFAVT